MNDRAPPRSARLSVLLPFSLVTLIWGSTWLVIHDQLGVVPASWSVAYRFLTAALVMFGVALVKRVPLRLDARGWRFALALGLAQFVLNFNFVYLAESRIASGLVAVVYALLLVPNAILGRIFLGQRLGRQLLVGSAIAIAGVALLFLHEARQASSGAAAVLPGIAAAIAGVMSASAANVMQGTQTAKAYPMPTMLGWSMLLGSAIDAAFAWAITGPPVVDPRIGYFLGVLYLGVFASAVAFTLYFGLIRVIGPAKAAYSGVITPVIAMLLSTVFEGYRWSLVAVCGGALALLGLVIALRARRPHR